MKHRSLFQVLNKQEASGDTEQMNAELARIRGGICGGKFRNHPSLLLCLALMEPCVWHRKKN